MKLTQIERLELLDIARGDEGEPLDVHSVRKFQRMGFVKVIENTDMDYAVLTPAGSQALKGGE